MSKKDKLTKKYTKLMEAEIESYDIEVSHGYVDDLLCRLLRELGYVEVVEVYSKVDKWYA